MKEWTRYFIDPSNTGKIYEPIDRSFEEHVKTIGGYCPDIYYTNKRKFFHKYLYNSKRQKHYHKFLIKHLKKGDDILSIASGRCANELFFLERGYKIRCSDLKKFKAYKETKYLFPKFDFFTLDIMKEHSIKKYDCIICLSLIYVFDNKELKIFFDNISNSLRPGGIFILDSGGSPDNLPSSLINEYLLRYESIFRRFIYFLLYQKNPRLIIKKFGYRRTDKEIINIARESGFLVECQQNYDYSNEFKRSYYFKLILAIHPIIEKILENVFKIIGKILKIPFIRMYKFRKA